MALCANGHSIVSLKKEEAYDPVSKSMIGSYWVGCSGCGLTLDEIRISSRNKPRKPRVPRVRDAVPVVAADDPKSLD